MSLPRFARRTLDGLTALLAACALGSPASAQEFPARPVQVIVPYAAGGADNYIRPLPPALEKNHNLRLVIESVVGAGGTVGSGRVKRAAPNGYTLLFCGSGALTIAPRLQEGEVATLEDFVPILNLATIPYIIAVRKDSPLRSAGEFIAFVRQNPGKLSYGTPGVGSAPHLGMEAFAARFKSSVTHVPFSGIATAVQSLTGGHIDAVIGAPSNVMPLVRGGQLVALAVSARERFSLTPEVPTMLESGADVEVATHFGFLAPRGTPREVVDRLAGALRQAAGEPAFRQTLDGLQTQLNLLPGPDYARALAAEAAAFAPLIARLPKQP